MELKPEKGMSVKVRATREAIFGDEEVTVKKTNFPQQSNQVGTLTGNTLAGYCEVEMSSLDGRKHWYPIEDVTGENGEELIEEAMEVEPDDEDEE